VKIYTKKGDDGSTGLFFGGRVPKDAAGPEAYGTVDEAVSALGVARALAGEEFAARILELQRALFVVGAELATAPENRAKLEPGVSLVTPEMVVRLEADIDATVAMHPLPEEFVVPGENPLAAALDVARTTVRRAERRVVTLVREVGLPPSQVVPFLNRLADHLYVLARSVAPAWSASRPERKTNG